MMRNKGYLATLGKKFLLVLALTGIFVLGIALQGGFCQYFYPPIPFMPLAYIPAPILPPLFPPPLPFFPIPFAPVPYTRAPQATIILSPGITAVSTTAGAVVIGAPTVVTTAAPTVVSTVPTVVAAPAPLFSILGIIYASALYESPLSVANPLLFAYLSSLVI